MVLLVGSMASLSGFLFFNWNPSRMFMGDTGSQFLGVFLAFVGIRFFWNTPSIEGQWEPCSADPCSGDRVPPTDRGYHRGHHQPHADVAVHRSWVAGTIPRTT